MGDGDGARVADVLVPVVTGRNRSNFAYIHLLTDDLRCSAPPTSSVRGKEIPQQ